MQLFVGVGGMSLGQEGREGGARRSETRACVIEARARVAAQRLPPTLHGARAEARNAAPVPHTRSGVPSLAAPVRPVRPVAVLRPVASARTKCSNRRQPPPIFWRQLALRKRRKEGIWRKRPRPAPRRPTSAFRSTT